MNPLELRERVLGGFSDEPLTADNIRFYVSVQSGQGGISRAIAQLIADGTLVRAPGSDYPWSWYDKIPTATYYFPAWMLADKKAEIAKKQADLRRQRIQEAADHAADQVLRARYRAEWDAMVAETLANYGINDNEKAEA